MNFLSRNFVSRSISRSLRFKIKSNKRCDLDSQPIFSSITPAKALIRPLSIAVHHDLYDHSYFSASVAYPTKETHHIRVVGAELHPEDALEMRDNFDKIVLCLSHGEVTPTDENAEEFISPSNLSLSGRGFGQAMSASGETARYFSSRTLMPELFIVAPQRCAIQSALIAFPTFSPNSIHRKKWISNQNFSDAVSGSSDLTILKDSFPGISFDTASSDDVDIHSFLSNYDEKVIVISSTLTWIENFLSEFDPLCGEKSKPKHVRVIGIKYL